LKFSQFFYNHMSHDFRKIAYSKDSVRIFKYALDYFKPEINFDISVDQMYRESLSAKLCNIFEYLVTNYPPNIDNIIHHFLLKTHESLFDCQIKLFRLCCKLSKKGYLNFDYNPKMGKLIIKVLCYTPNINPINWLPLFIKNIKTDPIIWKTIIMISDNKDVKEILTKHLN
jgi:hypothetical protein